MSKQKSNMILRDIKIESELDDDNVFSPLIESDGGGYLVEGEEFALM